MKATKSGNSNTSILIKIYYPLIPMPEIWGKGKNKDNAYRREINIPEQLLLMVMYIDSLNHI